MRKTRRFLSLTALSLCICVGTPSLANAEIYTKETLPNKPANLNRAVDATHKLEQHDAGALCTAVSVSPDGYVLTNLHCVMPCLEELGLVSGTHRNPLTGRDEQGVVDVEIGRRYNITKAKNSVDGSDIEVVSEEQVYKIRRVRDQSPKRVVCENYRLSLRQEYFAGAAWHINEQYFYGGRIIWLGRGSMTFADEHVASFTDETVRQLRDTQDDFAILKFELPEPVACMPVSPTDAKYGDAVWVVGYPMHAKRDSGLDSPGSIRAVSMGRVRGSVAEDPYLRNQVDDYETDLGDNRDPETGKPKLKSKLALTVADWLRLLTIYESPDSLLTDLDAMPGNSGSLIIDKNGDARALLHSGVAYSTKKHLGATVSGVRMSTILDEVRAGLGQEKYNQIFSCPRE